MDSNTILYRIAFAAQHNLSIPAARQLLEACGSEENFFAMSPAEISHATGSRYRLWTADNRQKLLERARKELDFVDAHNIRCLYFTESDYPQRLLNCEDAPLMLYAKGSCDLNAPAAMAVVGTRHATAYGTDVTSRLVTDLASAVITPPVIVSGLALGIDIAAHRAALKAGIPTVAVLAHGLNSIYPAVHRNDAAAIINSGGAVITDYLSTDAIHRGNFLARNRIVAGMTDGLLVTESAAKGGALVTARLAAGYDREVMAVPGRVNDIYSQGCNRLIASNLARLVTSAADIAGAMRWPERHTEGEQRALFDELTIEENTVIDTIRATGEASFASLLQALKTDTGRLTALLVDMEFKGHIRALPGGKYRLSV